MTESRKPKQSQFAKETLRDFSLAQVIASSLSAVTSVLLAPHIGIIGGVIGVAVGAAIAAVASQIYKGILHASARRLMAKAQEQSAQDTELIDLQEDQSWQEDEELEEDLETSKPFLRLRGILVILAATCVGTIIVAALIMALTRGQGLGEQVDPVVIIRQQVVKEKPAETSSNKQPEAQTQKSPEKQTPDEKKPEAQTDNKDSSEQTNKNDESSSKTEDKNKDDTKANTNEGQTQPKPQPNPDSSNTSKDQTKPSAPTSAA